MSPTPNARVLFNKVPEGFPGPETTLYDTSQTIDLEHVSLQGGFLVKILALSIEPYLRFLMDKDGFKDVMPSFVLGEPLWGPGVGVVVRSEHDGVKEGEHVAGMVPHQEYTIQKDLSMVKVIENKPNLPWSVYLGALGVPGKTAYYAWKEYAHPKRGETVYISGAASAVGSFVVQLAKMDGLRVIASAGSEEKVKYLQLLGADVAFNYRTEDVEKVLERDGPIDIYWDNVGGATLDAALVAANRHARFIECGMISAYNTGAVVKNMVLVFKKGITLYGFLVLDLEPKYESEFYQVVPELIRSGKIRFKEEVFEGLDKVGEAITEVQRGESTGKVVVKISD
ncbi:alcohol dehydrogenase [Pluteus cervinus]|uniref:Alcohol dehydrogenase n=1 Tax=Pluteus cervinus TaxID=181527 RepID=A0ACD3AIR1_9AGAR|nr:alcohol dehydrogenase [Pluteus cervinus]